MITKFLMYLRKQLYKVINLIERNARNFCHHEYENSFPGSIFSRCEKCLDQKIEVKANE